MTSSGLLDAAGRRRSPATLPGYLGGRAPRNKGMRYPADPPRPEEIVLVMRQAGNDRHGLRLRALIAVLWRGGLRISEALAVYETDVDERRGSLRIRHGKGDKRRDAGMDEWGFEQLGCWLEHRVELPVGPLFCVIDGLTRGRAWSSSAARAELRQLTNEAGVRRRFAPHQLRHAHAVELAREGVAVNIIQRQLGHTDLGTTSTYLQGIDPSEVIDAVRSRRQPTISAPPRPQAIATARPVPSNNGLEDGTHRPRLPLQTWEPGEQKQRRHHPLGDEGAASAGLRASASTGSFTSRAASTTAAACAVSALSGSGSRDAGRPALGIRGSPGRSAEFAAPRRALVKTRYCGLIGLDADDGAGRASRGKEGGRGRGVGPWLRDCSGIVVLARPWLPVSESGCPRPDSQRRLDGCFLADQRRGPRHARECVRARPITRCGRARPGLLGGCATRGWRRMSLS
jgi:hypothetical protein